MNKKGLSSVVSTMLMIVITIVAFTVIATSTNIFVKEKLDKSQYCFDLFNKVNVNDEFTCYDRQTNQTYVSISIGDVEVEGMLVAITFSKNSFNFELEDTSLNIPLVQNYNGSLGVQLPGKEGGRTYVVNGTTEAPVKIEIAPKTDEIQCEVVDSLENIEFC